MEGDWLRMVLAPRAWVRHVRASVVVRAMGAVVRVASVLDDAAVVRSPAVMRRVVGTVLVVSSQHLKSPRVRECRGAGVAHPKRRFGALVKLPQENAPALRQQPGAWSATWVGGADMANATCSINDCGKPVFARDWCRMHYGRWQRHGDPAILKLPPKGACSIEGCDRPHMAYGYCSLHYKRWKKRGDALFQWAHKGCAVDGCKRPHCSRGFCALHYDRFKKHGDPLLGRRLIPDTAEGFWSLVDFGGDCWLWTGAQQSKGYGTFKRRLAHRVAYELLVGPIADGLELDHLCRVHHCVNPDHLEPVTHRINMERGVSPSILAARAGRCQRGHGMTPENTYVSPDGGRQCRICRRLAKQRWVEARRQAS